jgi:hypothetical protein
MDIKKGGKAIPYHEEDPFLRREFEQGLAKDGMTSRMEEKLYRPPVEEAA